MVLTVSLLYYTINSLFTHRLIVVFLLPSLYRWLCFRPRIRKRDYTMAWDTAGVWCGGLLLLFNTSLIRLFNKLFLSVRCFHLSRTQFFALENDNKKKKGENHRMIEQQQQHKNENEKFLPRFCYRSCLLLLPLHMRFGSLLCFVFMRGDFFACSLCFVLKDIGEKIRETRECFRC